MVDFMEKHPDLAKGHLNVSNAKSKSNDLWKRLCQDLDGCGPPTHECAKWKKVWADYKNHIKSKCRKNRSSISGTGGGPSQFCSLTQLEQRVVDLLSIDEAVRGMDGTSHFGTKRSENTDANSGDVTTTESQENDYSMEEYINMACDDSNHTEQTINRTPRKQNQREHAENKDSLLQKQVDNQIAYQDNSVKVMTEIDNNMKSCLKILTEVNQNLTGVNKYLKRSSDCKEKKYKLAKEKFEFKKQKFEFKKKMELEKTKRKVTQLELKKQIFELESKKHG